VPRTEGTGRGYLAAVRLLWETSRPLTAAVALYALAASLLLILDEPTASLDAITEAALFDRYLAARTLASRSGAITLLVSHRFSTVRTADLIVVLEHGRITAAGDHGSLMREGDLYAELFELQAQGYR
jgi:ATP-binding cassette, subfamily B, bacterial